MGYADFLLKHLLAGNSGQQKEHPLCVYGCLACLDKFGPHIAKKILLRHVVSIVAGLHENLAELQGAISSSTTAGGVGAQDLNMKQTTETNLRILEQICRKLNLYLL